MKGIELSEKYFQTHGLPMIMEKFKDHENRIAAGLVGDGSECFGFDDEFSQDHDWGPGFCVWLTPEDYKAMGKNLQCEISRLPQTFMNFGPRILNKWSPDRIGVFEIPLFYRNFIGMDHLPSTLEEWMVLPENNLAACTNGKVFCDPLGNFSHWRETLLKFYPEDIRLKKIASRCMTIAQSGQYNYKRCINREEYFAAQYAETKFCADVISLIFLLNKKYTPFYKWMHRALKKLPLLGEWSYLKITDLIASQDMNEKPLIIEEICLEIISALQEKGLTDSMSSFLLDHGPSVQSRIKDTNLRQRNVWIG